MWYAVGRGCRDVVRGREGVQRCGVEMWGPMKCFGHDSYMYKVNSPGKGFFSSEGLGEEWSATLVCSIAGM